MKSVYFLSRNYTWTQLDYELFLLFYLAACVSGEAFISLPHHSLPGSFITVVGKCTFGVFMIWILTPFNYFWFLCTLFSCYFRFYLCNSWFIACYILTSLTLFINLLTCPLTLVRCLLSEKLNLSLLQIGYSLSSGIFFFVDIFFFDHCVVGYCLYQYQV